MQNSFSVRVGKTFDSLPGSWTLEDEKIDGWECNRDKDSPEHESELNQQHDTISTDDFGNELKNDLLDLFDDEYLVKEEEEQLHGQSAESVSNPKTKPDDYDDEQWEIKTSIGLDLTLEYEDEEDGYDRFAVGLKGSIDPSDLYEYDDDSHETDIDEVPNMLNGFSEDSLEYGIKTLLKRMSIDDDLISSTREKRVRFHHEGDHEVSKDHRSAAVPDYIRNPSRYTHYTFDSSNDMDDISNNQAFLNFRMQLLRLMKSDTVEAGDDTSVGDSEPLALVLRKKSTGASKELAPARIRPIAFLDST
ncbi:uncharacterized protein LOC126796904 [Argentina anserina]|uniref:uncharacterized protein LOC126796904 n=1 Tax=Argentina anserina TaxID=57926 RepID=UPI00217690F8|nr:uncharacterized protein LOC126796904 [Potentilla anserina]